MKIKKKLKEAVPVFLCIFVALALVASVYGVLKVREDRQKFAKYEEAFLLYKSGEFEEAEEILRKITGYKGVMELLRDIHYQKGLLFYHDREYFDAREQFFKVSNYQDSQDYIEECTYQMALEAYGTQDYDTARGYFVEIKDYKDVSKYLDDLYFVELKKVFATKFYSEAEECIFAIPDYPGVEPYAIVVLEELGRLAFEAQQYERAGEMYRLALEYEPWVKETYKNMPPEEKAANDTITGEVSFEDRLDNIEDAKEASEREFQAVKCLKELVKYYENNMVDVAAIEQVDEVRFAKQTYTNDAVVPIIMISYKENVNKKKEQAYAVYNETDMYGICHSLKMEEIDKANSQELQTNLKIAPIWEAEDTIIIDMERMRSAMGWK